MNTNNVTGPNANTAPIRYTFSRKKSQADVHPLHLEEAVEIDSDKDKHLSDVEIKNYLKDRQILRDPKHYDVDEAKIVDEYKMTLQNKPLPQSVHYHSYDEVVSDMKGPTGPPSGPLQDGILWKKPTKAGISGL